MSEIPLWLDLQEMKYKQEYYNEIWNLISILLIEQTQGQVEEREMDGTTRYVFSVRKSMVNSTSPFQIPYWNVYDDIFH